LLPEGSDESSATLSALELGAGEGAELVEILGTEVRQVVLLPVGPEVLDGIELGRIGRQELQLDVSALGFDPVAHQTAAMSLQTIPDDEQLASCQMPAQVLEEVDDLGGTRCCL
jgi:hypothetical protein